MESRNSVGIHDLREQYSYVETLSPIGFEAALNVLDQNDDYFVDDYEVFDVFGVKRSCQEFMAMLGFDDYSQLVPQTIYYGECPMSAVPPLPELDNTCFPADPDVNQHDAQVALDFLMSLSFYLRSNRDVIQDLESSSLFFQCTAGDQQSVDHYTAINRKISATETNTPSDVSSDPDNTRPQHDKPEPIASSDVEEWNKWVISNKPKISASDPQVDAYIDRVCSEAEEISARLGASNSKGAVPILLERDAYLGNNLLDTVLDLPENTTIDCEQQELAHE